MSDIDIQSIQSGAIRSVAESNPEFNSYQENYQEDFPVVQEFLDPVKPAAEAPAPQRDSQPLQREPSEQEFNFKALRNEVDLKKAEIAELRQNIELLRNHVQQIPRKQEEPQNTYKRSFDLDKSEVPNVGEIEAAWEKHEASIAQRETALREQMDEVMIAQRYPDYAEVLQQHTAKLLKEKPHLLEGLRGASNKALYAYELGKLAQSQAMTQMQAPAAPAEPRINPNAQKIVDNARKPRTLAQAGGQSALSQADYYSTMSDKEFMEMASKNLDY